MFPWGKTKGNHSAVRQSGRIGGRPHGDADTQEAKTLASQGKLLIVKDEADVRDQLARWFREEGYEVGVAENAHGALARMAEHSWDVALVGVKMAATAELQRRIQERDPRLTVIVMASCAVRDAAVAALKNGAYDYATEPCDRYEIAHRVRKALAHKRAEEENRRWRQTLAETVSDKHTGAPKTLDEIEKAHILRVLEHCQWNQTRAAEILRIDRVTLHHKLKRYGWTRPAATR